MSKLDKEQVIEKFTAAYEAANGKAPEIEAAGGWYSVDGGKKMRLAQLDEIADELSSSGSSSENTAAEDTAVEAKEQPAEEEPSVKKVHEAKKTQAKASRFSVKGFWIEQLDQDKPGSTAPR